MATAASVDASSVDRSIRIRRRQVTVFATVAAAVLGVSLAELGFGSPAAIAVLSALAVAVFVWRAPTAAIIFLVGCAAVIEQFSLVAEGTFSDGTDRIPFFQSLNTGAGLGGIYATPFELFLGLLLFAWLIKGFAARTLVLRRTPMSFSLAAFAFLVGVGWVRGVLGGGSFTDSLLELRPWLYLVITFTVTSQLIKTEGQLRALLYALVTGIGLKGIQGVITLSTHAGRPQAILAHEESFFFGLFIALLAVLWMLGAGGRLRILMTVFFPFVLISDIANQRRTAWAIAAAVLITVFLVCFAAFPEHRKRIATFGAIGACLAAMYWVGFSNDPGLGGQPARAVLSVIAPSGRDQQSNQYRTVENVNLGIAIRQTMPLGTGFGHPIPQAVPNVDISNIDSFISYLPHNGVLYLWLRLGLLGIVAFWSMIGIAVMTAITTMRRQKREIATLITLTVLAAIVAYVAQGFYDMGLYWFRIATVMGCLIGALEALGRMEPGLVRNSIAPSPERVTRGLQKTKLDHAA